MTNYSNSAKMHENSVKNANHAESVGNILDNVENVPFALRGSQVKTILYFLFSFIAAAELTAALTFYTMSIGLSLVLAAVFCGLIAFGFHALLHGILSDTAKGVVFSKRKESGAMSNEVTGNIILSIVLLGIASCTVFFVGKKGFTAYRATQYEKKQDENKPKGGEAKGIDASMLTNKSGKIAAWKLEALTDLEKAKAKGVEATTASVTANREAYDATTAQITDIVGASAFILELLLALLAYSIATAKLAAVMDEIARRNGASQPSQQAAAQNNTQQAVTNTAQAASNTANNTPSVTPQAASDTLPTHRRFVEYSAQHQNRILEIYLTDCDVEYNKECLGQALTLVNPFVLFGLYGKVSFSEDVFDIYAKLLKTKTPIEPQTAVPTTPKTIGFSDNKATKTGNEGRTVIQGFARKNSEKTPITASVTDAVTDAVTEKDYTHLRMCLWCESEYIYKIHNQKFCCEDCRIAAWNDKTGKQLRKVSKA